MRAAVLLLAGGVALGGTALSGCGDGGANFATIGGGIATSTLVFGATKKLPPDFIASWVTGRDCSIVSFDQTGHYCPPNIVVDRSSLYCYRTLAGVDCHQTPDPYQNGNTALASPPPLRVEQ
ncbi:MAG: hypothetical protein GC191_05930 [Azospirillum sp.]|nr:hypothetical protein [Azospirillum sp.]